MTVFLLCSVFLAEQFESLQSHLDTMMPAAKKPFLQQFYSQVFALLMPLAGVVPPPPTPPPPVRQL